MVLSISLASGRERETGEDKRGRAGKKEGEKGKWKERRIEGGETGGTGSGSRPGG